MTPTVPTAAQRILHFILPVLFVTMSAVFLAVPYGMGQWPGGDAPPEYRLLACVAGQASAFRGS